MRRKYYSKEIKGIYKRRYRITDERYKGKVMHGYYEKKLEQDPGIDRSLSFIWKTNRNI